MLFNVLLQISPLSLSSLTDVEMQRATQRKEDYGTVVCRISPNLVIHVLELTRGVEQS